MVAVGGEWNSPGQIVGAHPLISLERAGLRWKGLFIYGAYHVGLSAMGLVDLPGEVVGLFVHCLLVINVIAIGSCNINSFLEMQNYIINMKIIEFAFFNS